MYQKSSSLSLAIDSSPFDVLSDDRSKGNTARAFSFLPGKGADAVDCLIIRGELDIGVHSRLRSVLTALKPSSKALVIDLTRVTYIDCSSLRLLAEARVRLLTKMRQILFQFDIDGIVWYVIRRLKVDRMFAVGLESREFKGPAPAHNCARNGQRLRWATGG